MGMRKHVHRLHHINGISLRESSEVTRLRLWITADVNESVRPQGQQALQHLRVQTGAWGIDHQNIGRPMLSNEGAVDHARHVAFHKYAVLNSVPLRVVDRILH